MDFFFCLNHNISLSPSHRSFENDGNRNNINLINLTWFIFNVFSIRKDNFFLAFQHLNNGNRSEIGIITVRPSPSSLRSHYAQCDRKQPRHQRLTMARRGEKKRKSKWNDGSEHVVFKYERLSAFLVGETETETRRKGSNANFLIRFSCSIINVLPPRLAKNSELNKNESNFSSPPLHLILFFRKLFNLWELLSS